MDGDDFMARWRLLPLWLRVVVFLMMPIVWLWIRIAGPRAFLLSVMEDAEEDIGVREPRPTDQPADAEPRSEVAVERLWRLLLDERDQILASVCDSVIETDDARRIAVLYGAAHMPRLIDHLRDRHGYRRTRHEWVEAIAENAVEDDARSDLSEDALNGMIQACETSLDPADFQLTTSWAEDVQDREPDWLPPSLRGREDGTRLGRVKIRPRTNRSIWSREIPRSRKRASSKRFSISAARAWARLRVTVLMRALIMAVVPLPKVSA